MTTVQMVTRGGRLRDVEVEILPRSAWPSDPPRRNLRGPRPQLKPEVREHLAEFHTITAPEPPGICVGIAGYAVLPDDVVWAERRWSGVDARKVLCGRAATVRIGDCNLCDEHGASVLARLVREQLLDAGMDVDAEPPLHYAEGAEEWDAASGIRRCFIDHHHPDYPWKGDVAEVAESQTFGNHLRELGPRVVEPLWGLFADEEAA